MWREVSDADLKAALSEQEARAFSRTDGFDDAAARDCVANAVAHARGFIRSGRRCRMAPDARLLPEMLVAPTMDFACFNLLKRFNRPVNESRTKAYERACALFEKVGTGLLVPEDWGEAADAAAASAPAAPSHTAPAPERMLD